MNRRFSHRFYSYQNRAGLDQSVVRKGSHWFGEIMEFVTTLHEFQIHFNSRMWVHSAQFE